jgi:UDP-N-acetylglucosamine--N-acetylmuramyl-(pentapeptide) pyrophosphoryl-undecaprenol N-acetylglucosamine transferase
MKANNRLLIAGGGTGGHVLAGVAIADEWIRQLGGLDGKEAEVLFVGSAQGLESKLVPKAGYSLKLLKIGALNKVSLKTRLQTMVQLPLSFLKTFFILCAYRPHAVIGVGGYSSGPVVLLARILSPLFKTRTAIIEQNSVAGFTNRMLGRRVQKVFCAFAASGKSFEAKKVVVTGNPIRSSLRRLPPSTMNPFTLFIFGGSQGAQGINTMILDALPFLKNAGVEFIHQTGVKDFERVQAGYQREGIGGARIERFIDDMNSCYAKASLVICRAGASTLSELASVGRAGIFIPLPTAADNHQEKNARIFEQDQAAWVVTQGSLTGSDFAKMILNLKSNPPEIQKVEMRVQKFYQSDSAFQIVQGLR